MLMRRPVYLLVACVLYGVGGYGVQGQASSGRPVADQVPSVKNSSEPLQEEGRSGNNSSGPVVEEGLSGNNSSGPISNEVLNGKNSSRLVADEVSSAKNLSGVVSEEGQSAKNFSGPVSSSADRPEWLSRVFTDQLWGVTPSEDPNNPECRLHSRLYQRELSRVTLWAVQMSDSNAVGVTGLLGGDTHNLGHFDSCVSVAVPNTSLAGQYCLATLQLHLDKNTDRHYPIHYDPWASAWQKIKDTDDGFTKIRSLYHWGVCVPASCSAQAVEAELRKRLEPALMKTGTNATVVLEQGACYSRNRQAYGTGFFLVVLLMLLLVVAVIIATGYDMITYKLMERKRSGLGKAESAALAFSLYTNFDNLVKPDPSNDFDILHGLRALTMILVISGHRSLFSIAAPLNSPEVFEEFTQDIKNVVNLGGTLIVDTFFIMSAFLAAFIMFRQLEKSGKLPILKIIILRFLRIWPMYGFMVAFHAFILPFLGEGPIWQMKAGVEAERCRKNWWTNLLFINNYINVEGICMIQSWYLASDMHFFLIAPFIVLALWKYPKKGVILLLSLTAASAIIPAVLVYTQNYDATLRVTLRMLQYHVFAQSRKVFTSSHMRATPYFFGIAAFYLTRHLAASKITFSRRLVDTSFGIGFVAMMANFLVGWPYHISRDAESTVGKALYASLHRVVWASLMSWAMVAGARSQYGFVRPFLTMKALVPLSRLSYCAYLAHDIIQIYSVSMLRSSDYFDLPRMVILSLGDAVVVFLFSLVCYLLLEGPSSNLIKIFLIDRANRVVNNMPELEPKENV